METVQNGNSRIWIASIIVSAIVSAFVSATFSIFVWEFQQKKNAENLQTAYLAEIQVILSAVRRPAKMAFNAWDQKRSLTDHKFYYPHTVFDGNIAHLGELQDKKLVHDITLLYSVLEQALDEGHRLEVGKSDPEGSLRYAHYLVQAYADSMRLIEELSGEFPKVTTGDTERGQRLNAIALKLDTEFLNNAKDKFNDALFPPEEPTPTKKSP
jgi:hypothetical protein